MINFRIYLRIISVSLSPESITAALGIEPSEIIHVGTVRPRTKAISKWNEWRLMHLPTEEGSQGFIVELTKFVETLDSYKVEIHSIAPESVFLIQCVSDVSDTFPPLHFDVVLLHKMSQLNLSLDIDLYRS